MFLGVSWRTVNGSVFRSLINIYDEAFLEIAPSQIADGILNMTTAKLSK